jgi:DNA-binding NtrC family response regulator
MMNRRLLIVDDEIEIREMLSRHFRFLGYEVFMEENGLTALHFLERHRIDVVVSDIMMPGMDGVTLLKRIRREYPMIHVVMITGYVTLENALTCMRYQADACIFKPLEDLTELEESVANAFRTIDTWKRKFKELQGMKTDAQGGH